MKRCPECRRDYHDDSLLYCLEDGAALVQGSVPEYPTAIYSEPATAILPESAVDAHPHSRKLQIGVVLGVLIGTAIGLGGYFYYERADSSQIESIAVMPFLNESGEPEFDYLADGIPEGIINSLSQLQGLKVMSRNSVFNYKGKEFNAKSVASELNVRAVLTGRLLRRGDGLAINIELVDAQDNSQIWGQRYSRKVSDVFVLQEEISREVSDKLRIRLTGAQSQQLARRPTENLRAFQYYMQGRSSADLRTLESLLAALRFYERAIQEDSNYALAYAGLAEAYAQLGIRGYIVASEGRRKSEEAGRKALELDQNLAEAHVANGLFHIVLPPHDFSIGDAEMRRAIELSPSLAIAHFYLGVSLVRQGKLDEALEKNLKARELDPLSPIIARQMAIHYFFKRDYPRALEHLRQANELGSPFSVSWEIGVYVQSHRLDDAIAELEQVKRARADDPVLIYSTGAIYAAQGKRSEALKIAEQLESLSGATRQHAHNIAKLYAALDDKEMAFSSLSSGLKAGAIGAFYKDEPVWDPIRKDARFGELLRRMNIPE